LIRRRYRWEDGIYDSEVEIAAVAAMYKDCDKRLHQFIAYSLGPEKVCLLSDKPKDWN